MTSRFVATGAFVLGLCGGAAHATDWTVTLGVQGNVSPPFEGAGHYVTVPSGVLRLQHADKPYRFSPPDDPSSLALISTRYLVAGPAVRFRYARGDSGVLSGLQHIDNAVEPGGFVNLYPFPWFRLHGEARRGVVGHAGLVGDAGVDVIYQSRRFDISLGPRIGYGDKKYMDTYFGVTPLEAARNPSIRAPYEPDGGRRYTGVEFGASYHLTQRLFLLAGLGYHKLSNKIAISPVVELDGSKDQYYGSMGVTWKFNLHT